MGWELDVGKVPASLRPFWSHQAGSRHLAPFCLLTLFLLLVCSFFQQTEEAETFFRRPEPLLELKYVIFIVFMFGFLSLPEAL